eukprot:GFYU01008596.1.p1 GENE.GFYU01008596.1~~GFYU01008596.1.p1  ORF type:complete len:620 (-),score=134.98 GFYU01008596.1:33-1790(-)
MVAISKVTHNDKDKSKRLAQPIKEQTQPQTQTLGMGDEKAAPSKLKTLFAILQILFRLFLAFLRYAVKRILGINADNSQNPLLKHGHGPVRQETQADDLKVVYGRIPSDLNGQYVRNGPNPYYEPTGPYHWFDGDGMLHGVEICGGKASYINRWVKTTSFKESKEAGRPLFMCIRTFCQMEGFFQILEDKIKRALGLGPTEERSRTANTSVEFHSGRFLAIMEADHPHQVHLPDLETVGAYDFSGDLTKQARKSFTAHPKVDGQTNEMFFFGYSLLELPYLYYGAVSPQGKLLRTIDINLARPVMMHDFAISENYAIIMDLPLCFVKENVVKNEPVFTHDRTQKSRFGLAPRDMTHESQIKWFESPSCYVFHTAGAYEEGDEVVLVACRSDTTSVLGLSEDDGLKKGNWEDTEEETPFLYEWRFNIVDGSVKERRLGNRWCEFVRTNDRCIGHRFQYIYGATEAPETHELKAPLFDGVMKYDIGHMENGRPKEIHLKWGEKRFGGEAAFAESMPNGSTIPAGNAEDDGYLMAFVTDEVKEVSTLAIVNAQTMKLECEIELPQRVPYGFHGKWVTRDQIENQNVQM